MIVLDPSAVLAIIQHEPEEELFRRVIQGAGSVLISAGSAVELAAVSIRSRYLRDEVRSFLQEPFVVIEPVTASQAARAPDAFSTWGKGRHPAALNLGDMFAYLLARERGLPLLFKGNDFARTDVRNALEDAGDAG